MNYIFDSEVAEKIGVNGSIIMQNFVFWLNKNIATGKNIHDGRPWTFNSISAMTKLFPFWTEKQIRTIVNKLIKDGYIVTGNYNKSAYDRTKWYSFTENGFSLMINSILPNGQMNLPEKENEIDQKGEPIPDINTDTINTDDKHIYNREKIPYDLIANAFNKLCPSLPCIKAMTDTRKKSVKARFMKEFNQSIEQVEDFFRTVEDNDFLAGRKTTFRSSFDWLMKQTNTIKVLEGNYDSVNRVNPQPPSNPQMDMAQQAIEVIMNGG